jgi:hypothetical protein
MKHNDGLASDENLNICDESVKAHAKAMAVARVVADCAAAQLAQVLIRIPVLLNDTMSLTLRSHMGDESFTALCRAIGNNAAMALGDMDDMSDGIPISQADPGSTDVTQDVKIDTGAVSR